MGNFEIFLTGDRDTKSSSSVQSSESESESSESESKSGKSSESLALSEENKDCAVSVGEPKKLVIGRDSGVEGLASIV